MNRLARRITQSGFSVIEVILAAAIFMVFAGGIVTVVLQGLDLNRSGIETSIANQYAAEGLEAMRSIKNQAFSNLVDNNTLGVVQTGGLWTFSGVNNTFDKFTRVLKVESVQRDVSGNIVSSGGTVDSNTKKVTSTVTWNFSPTRSGSTALTTYLSDWRKIIANALIIYGDGTTVPKYRTYDNSANTFSSELSAPTSASGQSFIIKTSPTKQEAIAGYVTSSGVLQIMCFNGTTWTNEWTVNLGTALINTRRFDIGYETNTGDVVVLYSTNTGTNNELAYRTKLGSTGCASANWAAATNLSSQRTTGVVYWVKLAEDKRSSSGLVAALWADANSDLSSMIWSGTAWVNEPAAALETSLEVVLLAQDVEGFDLEYESSSGDLMVVWANSAGSNGVNGVRYATCNGGTSSCSWSAVQTPPTFVDDATNLDIAANPNTDEIVFASIGTSGSDLQAGYWSGSAWTNTANLDTTAQTPVAGSKLVAAGWLVSGATTRSVIVYNDAAATNVGWYTGSGGTFTAQTDFTQSPAFANPQRFYEVEMDPFNKDTLMLTVVDSANDLFAKRLVMTSTPAFTWSNSDGSAALETSLPTAINNPAGFAYWRTQ